MAALAAVSIERSISDPLLGWLTWGLGCGAALCVALLASAWIATVHPGPRLTDGAVLPQSPWAALRLPVLALLLVVGWWAVGLFAVPTLAAYSESARRGGLLLAICSLGALTFLSGLASQISGRLGRWVHVAPSWGVISALAIFGFFVAISVIVGSPSGSGSPWALFGVLARRELDLSVVLTLSAMLLGAVGGGLYGRFGATLRGRCWMTTGAALAAATGLFAVYHASQLSFSQGVRVERGGGIAALGLGIARGLSDRDADGAASLFGGGDCDDANPQVAPGRIDVPNNGLDEDCSGADRQREAKLVRPQPIVQLGTTLPKDANFLLLTIDTLRFDVGYSGQAKRPGLTPRLDELAARSTVFERAYSLASYTSKSLGPMLIGRYPSETARSFEHFDRFSASVPFLQERLQKAGIRTASVQGYWYFFFKSYGFERGWDILDQEAAPKVVAIEGDKTKNGDQLADRAIDLLAQMSQKAARFFAWVHWVDPHADYVRHEEFDYGSAPRDRYDGEVSFVDKQLGRVLARLEADPFLKNTVVMVTSDHGEAFGEHGMIRHGFEVWEELVRVPLLLYVPGAAPKKISAPRSLIDVAPTIAEVFALGGADDLRGVSLLADAFLPPTQGAAQRPVLVDMPQGPHNRERRAFIQGDYKLITSQGRLLGLYNFKSDPGELTDLSKQSALAERLMAEMESFLGGLEEVPASR